MTLLIPLGLLGLLGIVALIIIYIIRPNYLVKHVSSTYVWKLSLKYRKKRLPTSRLRNILIFICQVLILTAIAGILAKPALVKDNAAGDNDVIAIIDSSASMYAETGGETRFERAVDQVVELTNSTTDDGGHVSVIVAGPTPVFLGQRVTRENRNGLLEALYDLVDSRACSYGVADMQAAINLSGDVRSVNPNAKIYLYTDTEYEYLPDTVTLKREGIVMEGEWNVAILNANATFEDSSYTLTVQIAAYGVARDIELNVSVAGANAADANDAGRNIKFKWDGMLDAGVVKTVIFKSGGGIVDPKDEQTISYYDLSDVERFSSYQSIHLSIEESDSFTTDNSFDLYGGQKEVLKVEYFSTDPNPFVNSALDSLSNLYRKTKWDLQVTEVKKGSQPELEGYDFYIFEHALPERLPEDGVVFLSDPAVPDGATPPGNLGFKLGRSRNLNGRLYPLSAGDPHPILENMVVENIGVSLFTRIEYDASIYQELMYVNLGSEVWPMLLVQNDGQYKIAVMPFSVHYSSFATEPVEYFLFYYNMFEYFLPATLTSNAFEVGERIEINSRGPQIKFQDTDGDPENDVLTEFPSFKTFDIPGTYTLEQSSYFPDKFCPNINIFVKIPAAESDILKKEDGLSDDFPMPDEGEYYDDLLVYLAAALVALLFVEWWLQSREGR